MKIWNAMLMRIVAAAATVETNFMAIYSKSDGLYLKIGSVEQKVLTSASSINALYNVATTTPTAGDVLSYDGAYYTPTNINAMKIVNVSGSSSHVAQGYKTIYNCLSSVDISVTINLSNMESGSIIIVAYSSLSTVQRTCTLSFQGVLLPNIKLINPGSNTLLNFKYITEVMLIKGVTDWQVLSTEKTY